jgi:hypothetical protein
MNQVGPVEIAGAVVVIGYVGWLIIFFQVVRPWLMDRVGRMLGVRVHEEALGLDSGTYNVTGPSTAGKSLTVWATDIGVLLLGTIGVCACIALPGFAFVDSGYADRLNAALTGGSARIAAIAIQPMVEGTTTNAEATVRSESRSLLQFCRLCAVDYTERNGYLTGASEYFDLQPGEERALRFKLDALRRQPGTHTVRFRLECDNRGRDTARAELHVSP